MRIKIAGKYLLTTAFVVLVLLVANGKAEAQQAPKFGYFNLDLVISLMPGLDSVDRLLQVFERDSLGADYQQRLNEYQREERSLRADSARISSTAYEQRKAAVTQFAYILQNWQEYTPTVMKAKQQELMQPAYTLALATLQAVVAEGKYTYVFKQDLLWQGPPSDNLVIPVLKKLGIKVPDDLQAPKPPR